MKSIVLCYGVVIAVILTSAECSFSIEKAPLNLAYTTVAFARKPGWVYGYTEFECINNCDMYGRCRIDTSDTWYDCQDKNVLAPMAQTFRYKHPTIKVCLSRCGKIGGTDYDWCYVDQDKNWDYCNGDTQINWARDQKFTDTDRLCKTDCVNYCSFFTCSDTCENYWNSTGYCNSHKGYDYVRAKTINNKPCIGRCTDKDLTYNWCYYDISSKSSYDYCAEPQRPRIGEWQDTMESLESLGNIHERVDGLLARRRRAKQSYQELSPVALRQIIGEEKTEPTLLPRDTNLAHPWLESMVPLQQFQDPVHERLALRNKRALPAKKEVNKKTILPTLARQLENDPSLETVQVHDDSPVTSYTVLPGDGENYPTMPMVLRAKVRPKHIRSYRDRPASNICIPPAVVSNLELMGKRPGDHAGHLLAFTLGGPSEVWNFVPQLGRTNIGDYAREERIVRKFFKDNPKSDPWVDLLVVVVYSRVGRTMEKRPSGVSYYTMFYLGTRLVEQWFDILPNDAPPTIGPSNPKPTPGPDGDGGLLPCA